MLRDLPDFLGEPENRISLFNKKEEKEEQYATGADFCIECYENYSNFI